VGSMQAVVSAKMAAGKVSECRKVSQRVFRQGSNCRSDTAGLKDPQSADKT